MRGIISQHLVTRLHLSRTKKREGSVVEAEMAAVETRGAHDVTQVCVCSDLCGGQALVTSLALP